MRHIDTYSRLTGERCKFRVSTNLARLSYLYLHCNGLTDSLFLLNFIRRSTEAADPAVTVANQDKHEEAPHPPMSLARFYQLRIFCPFRASRAKNENENPRAAVAASVTLGLGSCWCFALLCSAAETTNPWRRRRRARRRRRRRRRGGVSARTKPRAPDAVYLDVSPRRCVMYHVNRFSQSSPNYRSHSLPWSRNFGKIWLMDFSMISTNAARQLRLSMLLNLSLFLYRCILIGAQLSRCMS